ncbi:hypothetical protein UY3_16188 [Chelonia mydas]|uniref:Uncharacterized protein n=1 Tax=Chelonia mydas TaxID=8469 RepID=M7B3V3_CHEMY|nr:hypothetical protein UY3_16188 [Chelonia mydas]
MSCRFYKELDAILGGDPPSTAKSPVDTSLAHVPVESGPNQEEAILDEEGEGEPEAEDESEAGDACSQELFSTLEEPSQSQQSDLGEVQTGEEAPGQLLCLEGLFCTYSPSQLPQLTQIPPEGHSQPQQPGPQGQGLYQQEEIQQWRKRDEENEKEEFTVW